MEQSTAASRPARQHCPSLGCWMWVNGLVGTAQPQGQGALTPWLPAHGVAGPKSPSTSSPPAMATGAQCLVANGQAGSAKFNAINPGLEA